MQTSVETQHRSGLMHQPRGPADGSDTISHRLAKNKLDCDHYLHFEIEMTRFFLAWQTLLQFQRKTQYHQNQTWLMTTLNRAGVAFLPTSTLLYLTTFMFHSPLAYHSLRVGRQYLRISTYLHFSQFRHLLRWLKRCKHKINVLPICLQTTNTKQLFLLPYHMSWYNVWLVSYF